MFKKNYPWLIILLIFILLINPELALENSRSGLLVWFQNMIPALYPYMVLSSLLISMQGLENALSHIYPLFYKIFHCSIYGTLVIISGFLFGMPMGSRVLGDFIRQNKISEKEACWLLTFCNQLSPAYMIQYAFPILNLKTNVITLLGFYGVPVFYGLIIRKKYLVSGSADVPRLIQISSTAETNMSFMESLNNAISSANQSILSMGGYLILFRLLYIIPQILFPSLIIYIGPLVEITSGLESISTGFSQYGIFACSFGGLCCVAQTVYTLRETNLRWNLGQYLFHRMKIALLITAYFLCFELLR